MLPSEINIPINAKIYTPNELSRNSLTFTQICKLIESSDIPEIVTQEETLVIINDAHRSTPSSKILDAIWNVVPNNLITTIAIATGTHEPPTEKELQNILRKNKKYSHIRVVIHDSLSEDLIQIGTTNRGTIVKVNPIINEYNQILCLNSVEPHYFAGFTGGIKSVIPGLAGKATVEKNHSWALDSNSAPTKVWDNPLQIDLWEAASFLEAKLFGLQIVNIGKEIYSISTGELKEAFTEAMEISKSIYTIKLNEKVDIVLSVVYPPLDRSLYQAQKGIENTRQILKKDGVMILFAHCREGVGNKEFISTLSKFENPIDVINNLSIEKYKFGDHKAVKFSTIAMESKLYIVSDLEIIDTDHVFAENINIHQMEDFLRKASDNGKSIAVIMDSGTLVLYT